MVETLFPPNSYPIFRIQNSYYVIHPPIPPLRVFCQSINTLSVSLLSPLSQKLTHFLILITGQTIVLHMKNNQKRVWPIIVH